MSSATTIRAGEEEPLLGHHSGDNGDSTQETEVILGFDPDGDVDNPRQWPVAYKWAIVLLLACMAFTV